MPRAAGSRRGGDISTPRGRGRARAGRGRRDAPIGNLPRAVALPKRGGRVVVLAGERRGQRGKLLDKKGEAASVQLAEDLAVQNFRLDDIAEYTGEEHD